MSRRNDPLSPWNSSKIPTHSKYGTVLSEQDRALMAKKMGICGICYEEKTHEIHIFKKTALDNDFCYKGLCIRCNKDRVPPDRYRNYKRVARSTRLPPPISTRNQSERSLESTGTERSVQTFEFPGTFADTPKAETSVKSLAKETAATKTSPKRPATVISPKEPVKDRNPQTQLKHPGRDSDLDSPAILPAKPPELFPKPKFHEAAPRPIVTVRQSGTGIEHEEEVFLVRNSRKTVSQAYRKVPGKRPIALGSNGLTLGEMVICVVLPRNPHATDIVFEEPNPNEYRCVAIKKWRRSVVDPIVQEQGNQNPYNEISIMQSYGKGDSHIEECVEALIDSQYVYAVWPYCSFCKPLEKRLSTEFHAPGALRQGLPDPEAKSLFLKLLTVAEYLQKSRICHRNLSPMNVAEIYGTEEYGSCKLQDYTSSLLIPHSDAGRHYIAPAAQCGELAYMAPEIYRGNKAFDGFAVDVWSLGTILFELLTGCTMCHMPDMRDRCFLHFILNRGLTNEDANLRMQEYLMDQQQRFAPDDLALAAQAVLSLDGTARDLLQGMLELDPSRRFSLSQVKQHRWCQ